MSFPLIFGIGDPHDIPEDTLKLAATNDDDEQYRFEGRASKRRE
jgi:hypothetical protein